MLRKELAVISFEFDSGGPSRIETWIPAVSATGVPVVWQPESDAQSMEAFVDANNLEKIIYLQNKQPKWDEVHGGHVLNFQGRVTESSVKNFQLCSPHSEDPDEVVLQFGRVGKHKFNMDLRYPMSPIQAFAVCVACLDGKIADRKGYEYFKKLTGQNAQSEATGVTGSSSFESRSGKMSALQSGQGSSSAGMAGATATQTDGSMKGSSTISGILRENIPSSQYIRDRLARSFK